MKALIPHASCTESLSAKTDLQEVILRHRPSETVLAGLAHIEKFYSFRQESEIGLKCLFYCGVIRAAPTASFQLPHVVTGEPPTLATEGALPPAPLLLPAHADDVALGERELVLIGRLEGEARLDQGLATPAAL